MPRFLRSTPAKAYRQYKSYKEQLRRDFLYRCAYCDITEYSGATARNFVVEHFRPQHLFPALTCVYDNLYYACNICNGFKLGLWPSEVEMAAGRRFLDPCECDPYESDFIERDDGSLSCTTMAAVYTCEHMQLNREQLRLWRRTRREMQIRIAYMEEKIKSAERIGTSEVLAELMSFYSEYVKHYRQLYHGYPVPGHRKRSSRPV